MYEAFYHLTADPFQLSPDPRFYFDSLSHKKAMAYLTYGLSRGEGFIVISGDTGKGKTTLAQRLVSNLDPSTYISVNLVTTQLDPTEMLRLVASGFGLDCAQDGKATIIERLSAFLKSNLASGRRPLLIVDEAQNLTSQSLEELRMLSNLQVEHRSALQIIFLAQPPFLSLIAKAELAQFRERIVASIDLDSLNRVDTQGYIEHRLRIAGWKGYPKISDETFDLVYRYSDGLPRRINKLCSRLFLVGSLDEVNVLNAAMLGKVIEEISDPGSAEFLAPASDLEDASVSEEALGHGTDDLARRIALLESDLRDQNRLLKELLSLFMGSLKAKEDPVDDDDA